MKLIRLSPLVLAAFAWQAIAQAPMDQTLNAAALTSAFGEPITSTALEDLRGGTNTVNEMWLNGTTASNSASHVFTGTNAITAGSFSNVSGIPIVIQNTGANVLIQNAVILNLKMN